MSSPRSPSWWTTATASLWRPLSPPTSAAGHDRGRQLIKNPGGAPRPRPSARYPAARRTCVDPVRATGFPLPGLGQEVGGPDPGLMPALYQGFFLAPTVVAGAAKRVRSSLPICMSRWASAASPVRRKAVTTSFRQWSWAAKRAWSPSARAFRRQLPWIPSPPPILPTCPATTTRSSWPPVPSFRAAPSSFPRTVPSRPPYAVYFQGGLTWNHAKIGISHEPAKNGGCPDLATL